VEIITKGLRIRFTGGKLIIVMESAGLSKTCDSVTLHAFNEEFFFILHSRIGY